MVLDAAGRIAFFLSTENNTRLQTYLTNFPQIVKEQWKRKETIHESLKDTRLILNRLNENNEFITTLEVSIINIRSHGKVNCVVDCKWIDFCKDTMHFSSKSCPNFANANIDYSTITALNCSIDNRKIELTTEMKGQPAQSTQIDITFSFKKGCKIAKQILSTVESRTSTEETNQELRYSSKFLLIATSDVTGVSSSTFSQIT